MGFRSANAIIVDWTAYSIDPAQIGTRKGNARPPRRSIAPAEMAIVAITPPRSADAGDILGVARTIADTNN
jgi:hypothetical protein